MITAAKSVSDLLVLCVTPRCLKNKSFLFIISFHQIWYQVKKNCPVSSTQCVFVWVLCWNKSTKRLGSQSGTWTRPSCWLSIYILQPPPPMMSWYKHEKTYGTINVTGNGHIKTELSISDHLEGISYLVFENISRSDSGLYQCVSSFRLSHLISVSVYSEYFSEQLGYRGTVVSQATE